jgi:hypothetical protein
MSSYTQAVEGYKIVKTESLKRRLDSTLLQESFLNHEEKKLKLDQEVLSESLRRLSYKRRAVVKKIGCLESLIKQLNGEDSVFILSTFIFFIMYIYYISKITNVKRIMTTRMCY